jgi:hypothetical protein
MKEGRKVLKGRKEEVAEEVEPLTERLTVS